MEKWFIRQKHRDKFPNTSLDLLTKTKLQILYNRDIVDIKDIEDYITVPETMLNDVNKMKDFDIIKSYINKSKKENLKVYIVGDYDVDGIMSTSIFLKTFYQLGVNVHYKIPHRVEDGYGINNNIVEDIANEGGDLIITCDNGIQAFEAAKKAKELGIDLIITDHHQIKQEDGEDVLPEAIGVIDPLRNECHYPFKELCGAGIVFKVCVEILKEYNLLTDDLHNELISFAAFATVCDVVNLIGENRYIATKGILALRRTKNIGLNSLIEVSGVNKNQIDTYHLGFILGPRFNASGRLDTASLGIELLITDDSIKADLIAMELNDLNEERKSMTEDALKKVLANINPDYLDDFIVEYVKGTHESVAGIVAGRVKERFHRPTIVLTDAKSGIKGSGRSIDNFNMFKAISACSSYLDKFGGHEMAAGISMQESNLEKFKLALNQYAKDNEIDLSREISVDALFPIALVDLRLLDMINSFRPFGKGNPEPLFADRNLRLKNFRVFGKNKNVIKLEFVTNLNTTREAVLFQEEDIFLQFIKDNYNDDIAYLLNNGKINMDIVYYPKLNEFRGVKNVDVVITNYRIAR
ncbi:single-stranded-DNA-specific exonuclease RecJ [uncultured Ezakiella sp.]|uniref:single-stranded-DNA-specific exonuclease RecJ n=1 Tax=uncultured Ezakiella sp. TaxID=1637529 RepID=UPI0025DA3394|nr:single-stranded-DNA-specific exonuclease RecJ [uncultured Ezakiella sp.]